MDTKIMTVGSTKCSNNLQKRRPQIKITGFWLNGIGFEYDKLVTVEFENGYLVFKSHEKGVDSYLNLVKTALKNKSGLLQVRYSKVNKRTDTPNFEVKGDWLNDLGFKIGSVIAVSYAFGVIKVKVVDLDKLDNSSNYD